jgi:hypothetical protein
MEEIEKMKVSDEMEPHGQALYRDGAGQARDTSPNTPWGRTSRTRGPIHPRVNPWSSWCRDRENRQSIQGEGNVGVNYPAAELRGIKIQSLFPCCHSCESRNPGLYWFPVFTGTSLDSHWSLPRT